jgi:hypothetical protein
MLQKRAIFAVLTACLLPLAMQAQRAGCSEVCAGGAPPLPDAPPVIAAPVSPPDQHAWVHEVEPMVLRAGEPFQPLSTMQKWGVFVHHTYSPSTFLDAGFDAAYTQATRGEPGYGQGSAGFGRRLGASLASSESDSFFERFLFPSLLHQDPRYFRAPLGYSTRQRGWFAAQQVFIGYSDTGHRQFNFSHVLGALASLAVSNAYLPHNNVGVGTTFGRWGTSLASDAGFNVLREFWPDIRHHFLGNRFGKRIAPMVQRTQGLMPAQKP